MLALAGTIGDGAHTVTATGVDAYSSILPAPVTLAEALGRGGEFLTDATERALRMIVLGSRLRTAPQPGQATLKPDQALAVSGTQRPSSVR